MHSKLTHALLAGGAAASLLLTASTAAGAYERSGDRDSDRNRGRASSYINPDTGAATANPDVSPNSNCFTPDQYDMQAFSPVGTTTRNVHNDACFLDNGVKVDGPASFQSSGAGFISACPDPDGAGPKVAVLNAAKNLCFQSGYQQKGTAGDNEFHARLNNNTGMAGTQKVTWCSDADRDGCDDEWNRSTIRIDWSVDGNATFSNDSWSSSYSR